jgi:hypothetical protein
MPAMVKMVKYWKFVAAMIWPLKMSSFTVMVDASAVSLNRPMK